MSDSGFGMPINIPGAKRGSIQLSAHSNPFAESVVPCENCGQPVTVLSVTGLETDVPTNLYEVELQGCSSAKLETHTPERCRAARQERGTE